MESEAIECLTPMDFYHTICIQKHMQVGFISGLFILEKSNNAVCVL